MRKRVHRARVSHERWLVSYADFITLLFALFVVLFASARADQKKQSQVAEAIDSAFKSLALFQYNAHHADRDASGSAASENAPMPINIVMGEDVLSPAQVKDDLERMRRDLTQRLSNQVANHTVALRMGRDGLVISLREAGFFDSGSATPHPEAINTLRQVAATLGQSPYDMRIEGHTDNVPIHTANFDSNWELSSARATRIARMFLDLHSVSPDRISAAGYAEYHPVDVDSTTEGRANNRRVDLVVMPRTKINLATEATPDQHGPWKKITDAD